MTWKSDMMNALDDESFHDVRLLGTDNIEVPCAKFLLATRSPIFKTMFFGEFRERESDLVNLNYDSKVLKVLVKYCYSDELDLDIVLDDESATDEEAILLVQLRDAANYFELKEIADHMSNEIGDIVFRGGEVGCVCAILTELTVRKQDEGGFWDAFFQLAVTRAKDCLLPAESSSGNKGAVMCPPSLLLKLLENVKDQFVVVRCLKRWLAIEKEDGDHQSDHSKPLWDFAKQVDFKKLTPLQLSKIKPCPLFPQDKLYDAFVYHGSMSKNSADSSSTSACGIVAFVSGAGVECLNGYYEAEIPIIPTFVKSGEYGGLSCKFKIALDVNDRETWRISIITNHPAYLREQAVHLYEAPLARAPEERNGVYNIPFAFWKCLDGKAPAPHVAVIHSGGVSDSNSVRRSKRVRVIRNRPT